MERDKHMIESSIAATAAKFLEPMGTQGLLDFLRKQVVDQQWNIARAQATIAAYEKAIAAIEAKTESSN